MSPSLEQRLCDTSFERLYRRHRRDVYGAVLRDVRDPEEAEDVTQIAFLNAFRAMRRGEEPKKPRAWLVTIARNVIRRRYRTVASRPQEVPLDPEAAVDLTEVGGPTAGEIAAAIRRLPPNQRSVILLREIQGRSYAEIADELDLSLSAVETLIFRARRSLSEELQVSDHVPATQKRRARSFFLFPLPGLGKLGSLGFSFGRVGLAAIAGGVAIGVVAISESGPDPLRGPEVRQAPVVAVEAAAGLHRTNAAGVERPKDARNETKSRKRSAPREDTSSGSGTGALPSVELPAVGLPSTGDLGVPTLPVETPPLSLETPPPSLEPPPLPVEPPPLPVDPPSLP
jgi:RNA polymerase sigma-70 factor, ECF subfamily